MLIYLNEEEKKLTEGKKEYTPLKQSFRTNKEETIVTLYKEGKSIVEIESKVQVSRGLIYTVLNTHKVDKRSNAKQLKKRIKHILISPEKTKEVIRDYQFMKLTDIYAKHDIHKNGLYYILDLYDIPRKSDAKEEALKDAESDI